MNIFIPDNLLAIQPQLQRFFDAMVYKLEKNAHKGNFTDVQFDAMRRRLGEEIDELDEAMGQGNSIAIVLEAADVANFALILADIAIKDAGKEGTYGKGNEPLYELLDVE